MFLKKLIQLSFVFCLLTFVYFPNAFAQVTTPPPSSSGAVEGAATMGVAHMVQVRDIKVKDGSILSTGAGGAVLTTIPYDSQVVGVVSRDAAIIFTTSSADNVVPVISTGLVYLMVSSREGNIKKGDLVTSSTQPGVSVKATKDGFVLGSAMEDYSNNDPNKIGIIAANLDLHYFNSKPVFPGSISDVMKLLFLPTKEGPSPLLKYIVAALVVLGSMVLGFLTFGRAASKGVEALGRNPAASKVIQLGIIFNVGIVVGIALAGLGVAFLIIRL